MLPKFIKVVLPLLTFTTPLLFWTLTLDYFTTPKELLLLLALVLLLLVSAYQLWHDKSLPLPPWRSLLPFLLFALAILTNLFVIKTGMTEALIGRGSLYLLTLTFGLLSTLAPPRQLASRLHQALVISGAVLAVFTLLELTLLHSLSNPASFLASRAFTPTGTPLTTLLYLLVAGTNAFLLVKSTTDKFSQVFFALAGGLMVVAVLALTSLMLPGGELSPLVLSLSASWSVALDALKTPTNLLVGVGLGNFTSHYTSVKPLFINSTPLWNILPSSLTLEPLHLLATGGLTIFLPFTYLLYLGLTARANPTLILATLAVVISPASYPLTLLFFVLLGLSLRREPSPIKPLTPGLSTSLALLLTLSALTLLYYGVKLGLAEYYMQLASKSLASGSGRGVYENNLRAVKLIPSAKNYRLAYSLTNLKLASALSAKSPLSEEDRSNISQLISQSVREARAAIALAPRDAMAWTNLGSVYRNLINVAEGADRFALASYAQAVVLDPANPALRLELGGLYYQLAQMSKDQTVRADYLSRAKEQFSLAKDLKPDYPNAYYNLSHALDKSGDTQGAYTALQEAIRRLPATSFDYASALKELDELRVRLPSPTPTPVPTSKAVDQESASASPDLSAPSPLPSPLPGGPLNLAPTE